MVFFSEPGMPKSNSSCCVPLCTKPGYVLDNTGQKVTFHKFPQAEHLKKTWFIKIRRDEGDKFRVGKSTRICSRHFQPSDFITTLKGRRFIKTGAIPSKFDWSKPLKERKSRKLLSPESATCGNEESGASNVACTSNAADLSTVTREETLQHKIESLEEELQKTKKTSDLYKRERDHLRTVLNHEKSQNSRCPFSLSRFQNNNADICFYTGFPTYTTLRQCLEIIDPGPDGQNIKSAGTSSKKKKQKQKLSVDDQFFLTLIRLRLGLFVRHLANMFSISVSSVNRICITWINFMYLRLGSLNIWPPKAAIQEHMPQSMKVKYPNLEWIIDACEIQCERPSSLLLQSQSYSSYKSRNTVKGLVACTPSGQIGFVSNLYTGNISDRELTERSGFIKMPHNKGAMWLVDKGFQIQDLADPLGVKVNMPAFVGGQKQMTAEQVFHTQTVASERIHIERAINKIKNFHIFDRPIPMAMLGSVNQIWAVCALLTLFQNPIISI